MTETPKKGFKHHRDYFIGEIEEGELAMRPYCACGIELGEDYFCEECHKQCLCTFVFCTDEDTLTKVQDFITKAASFKQFEASLLPE